ncbi:hypothetical protein Clacol_005174 [Clathrus columnatus]|uniref:Major facilitator superfamily (MFS) profile domain-containing protein n=1 Tax=Clathrus columnatus TaxID=1419009 RepID=A0AAV5AG82_9AGAM|nr:hypothetical protein Clacol_005174 [Clathrus columnatus]
MSVILALELELKKSYHSYLLKLTGSTTTSDEGAVYDRFSESRKRIIFAVVLWTSFLPSGAFASGFLNIAKDLKVDVTILNYILSSYIFFKAVAGLFWGIYATFYGRRFVYLLSLPLICAGSLGAALSVSAGQLAFSRILQAIGISSISSTGIAVISDIYRRENRGTAVGFLNGNPIPVIAPFLSGIITSYISWRAMHIVLVFMSSLSVIFTFLYLPETSHPGAMGAYNILTPGSKPEYKLLNPIKSLKLFKIPGILFWRCGIPWQSHSYGVESPILVGLCFFPADIGYVFGAAISGYLSDKSIIKSQKRQGGKWIPEDRLYQAFLSSLILVPPSVFLAGLTLEYVPGRLGLGINLTCLFVNGFGIGVIQSPAYAYILDILRERSAETKAINGAMENLFASIVSATILPSINTIGVGWSFAFIAGVGWIGSL